MIRYEETKYGFNYGALEISRLFSNQNAGWIIIRLKTPKEDLQVYVTKTGKVRIFGKDKEIPIH